MRKAKMGSRWLFAVSVGVLGCSTTSGTDEPIEHPSDGCEPSEDHARQAWADFRETFPYHVQTIALSSPPDGICPVVVLAEPPPMVDRASVERVLGTSVSENVHPIGVDGRTVDWVGTVHSSSDDEVHEVTRQLSSVMFGTDYKHSAFAIGQTPPSPTDTTVRPLPGDLVAWVGDPEGGVIDADGDECSVDEMLGGQREGVFFSQTEPLVFWALDRPASLDGRTAEARRFVLDSDLILGAVASDEAVVIVARERMTPISALPPLRYETLAMLAATTDEELHQSFERNNPVAGRMSGGRDWAPIYLSPQLVDSEFGSLLNLTDQILKGWSLNGVTQYVRFDYPEPVLWPFSRNLHSALGGTSLTFNWNTRGAGAVVEIPEMEVFWVHDSGSLPVTYLPDEQQSADARQAAERARSYFSSLEEPLLIRVVQYSALYQIFREFDVSSGLEFVAHDKSAASSILEGATFRGLVNLQGAQPELVIELLEEFLKRNGGEFADGDQLTEEGANVLAAALVFRSSLYDEEGNPLAEDALRLVAKTLANPDRDLVSTVEKLESGEELSDEETKKLLGVMLTHSLGTPSFLINAFIPDIEEVRKRYSEEYRKGSRGRIRTPSIVISKNRGNASELVGGHNISARVPRVSLRGRKARIQELDGTVRESRRIKSVDQIKIDNDGTVVVGAPKAPRTPKSLLGDRGPSGKRGLNFEPKIEVVQIEKHNGQYVLRSEGRVLFETGDVSALMRRIESTVDATKSKSIRFQTKGFRPDEARGLVQSTTLKARRQTFVAPEKGFFQTPVKVADIRVSESLVKVVDGASVVETTLSIRAASPLRVRMKLAFSRVGISRFGNRVREVVGRLLERVRARFGSRPAKFEEIALELRRELDRIDPGAELSFERLDEVSDFMIVRREPHQQDPTAI